jgi:phosphoheptose isomerase
MDSQLVRVLASRLSNIVAEEKNVFSVGNLASHSALQRGVEELIAGYLQRSQLPDTTDRDWLAVERCVHG